MTPPPPTPASPALQNLIEKAKENLAQRLSIGTDQISLLKAAEVVWPDSSLGCPQEGTVYTQVLTPGYLIVLGYGVDTFEYHASQGNSLTTCKNPFPPVPGTPDNT